MQFSVRKTIQTDWPGLAAFVGIPIIWTVHFAFPYLRPDSNVSHSVLFPASISLCLAVLLFWRLRRIAHLFASGRLASAEITRLSISRDRGRLEFAFEHQGQLVHSWTPVHKTKSVLALQPGARVEALFDPARPTHAIVKRLYEA